MGSALVRANAFDRFVLGRPWIDRLRIVFMSDANTAVAALLSGEAHIALDYLVMYEQGATRERQWAATHGGTVLFSPLLIRMSVFQFRPEVMASPAIMDVRFRRALAYAMDRPALNGGVPWRPGCRDGWISLSPRQLLRGHRAIDQQVSVSAPALRACEDHTGATGR